MKLRSILSFFLIFALSMNLTTAAYADTIKISHDGKSFLYSDLQVRYKVNETLLKSKYPGILVGGVSIANVHDVFLKTGMGIQYSFNKKTKNFVLSKGTTKLEMTLNSLNTKINGVSSIAPVSPRMLQFVDGKSFLYVPARYVAETFGYTYSWDASSGVATIVGDVKQTKAKKKNQKVVIGGKTYSFNKKGIIFSSRGSRLNSDSLPALYINSILMAPAKELFLNETVEGGYSFDKKKKEFKIEFDDKELVLKENRKTAYLNKKKVKLSMAPTTIQFKSSSKKSIFIPIYDVAKALGLGVKINGTEAELTFTELKSEKISISGKKPNGTISSSQEKKEEGGLTSSQTEKIEEKSEEVPNKKDQNPKKEERESKETILSSSTDSIQTGKTVFEWKTADSFFLNFLPRHSVTGLPFDVESEEYKPFDILDVQQVEDSVGEKYHTYVITASSEFYEVEGSLKKGELHLTCSNVELPKNKDFAFKKGGLSNRLQAVNDAYKLETTLKFKLTDSIASFDLSLSEDKKTLTVKMIQNTVTTIKGELNPNSFILTLKGLSKLDLKTVDRIDSPLVSLKFAGAKDILGVNTFVNTDPTSKVSAVSYYKEGNDLILSVGKTSDSGYYFISSDKEIKIIFTDLDYVNYHVNIPLPEDSQTEIVREVDDYLNNRFKLIFNKNINDFFVNKPIGIDGTKVIKYWIGVNEENHTILTFETKEIMAYKTYKTSKSIGVQVGKANEFYKKVIVIDPGHGAHDSGALSNDKKHKEKDVVLAVGYEYLKDMIEDKDLKVYWTRTGDTFMTLRDRASFASKVGADLFVSVHANYYINKKTAGTEVYYSTRNNTLQTSGLSSYIMASMFQKNLTSEMKTVNRGVKSNIFVVTNINTVPAVLLELGFMSNEKDVKMLTSPEKQAKMSKIIYETVREIFTNYPTGR